MNTTTRLLDCGHKASEHGPHTTGTAHTAEGREICWSCSYNRERDALRTASRYIGYLSRDGKNLNTWPGQPLARITRLWSIHNAWAGTLLRFRAVDVHGAEWYGTTLGPEMYARMIRSKRA